MRLGGMMSKPETEQGTYIHPEAYGVTSLRQPEISDELKAGADD